MKQKLLAQKFEHATLQELIEYKNKLIENISKLENDLFVKENFNSYTKKYQEELKTKYANNIKELQKISELISIKFVYQWKFFSTQL